MNERFSWWNQLRHGGLLLDTPRLTALITDDPQPLSAFDQDRLRRRLTRFQDDPAEHRGALVGFVLESVCGFARPCGDWYRGPEVKSQWSRRALTGESVRPRHLWLGKHQACLPVFVDDQPRLGAGRGRRVISQVLQWLRQGPEQLAVLTNGQEWRLIFAGLDYDAFCQWDTDGWFSEGDASPELSGFRSLFAPLLWTPKKEGEPCPLLAAVNDSRKGQADLSQILGERVRQAAELLIQAHTPALKDLGVLRPDAARGTSGLGPQDIYRAAVRMIMRLVVVLFAESREGLLARDNPVFHSAYSLQGLREQLERVSRHKLVGSVGAYPRILALLRLIHEGSSHPAIPVPAYGGELFAPGRPDDRDGMKRALHLFENACFAMDVMSDYSVREILDLLTRTRVKIRQGRSSFLVPAPVDFSSLDSEYIGILYEGLLDFELRCAAEDEPIVFLAVGNQPALPLSTLEGMDTRAIKNLLEKLKDTSSAGDEEEAEDAGDGDEDEPEDVDTAFQPDEGDGDELEEESAGEEPAEEIAAGDPRFTLKTRAEAWARRACQVGNLVRKPAGKMSPERQMQYERTLDRKARQLVVKVVLPGEWYLVRWGGTRKGSGTFYTRPQLAIPTVHRTLRPLAYDPPPGDNGQPDVEAPAERWTPKKPEDILNLKVCDLACGSGSFPLAALRFLTAALYESLVVHDRIREHGGRAVLALIYDDQRRETLASEALPCRPEDDDFEPRTKAVLRRYVVERCIYGVDLDPLAVELCRLSLWLETLDRSLPLTFLNHKIKCGNSLVGAWFDQFLHYPAMAWEREGGDKSHTNGVHFGREAWTKAIKEFKGRVKGDLIAFIDGHFKSMYAVDLTTVQTGHDAAEAALQEIHGLGIAQVGLRAARYEALLASDEFQRLKAAFDLWCALWFWPADQLDHAPLPTQFAAGEIDANAWEIVARVADRQRFFHWELEFPDVFNNHSHGFDAMLGNPPWDVAKPNSKEFFSAFDPLYRSYGKQDAIRKQTDFFQQAANIERQWLDYYANFKAMSNWVKYAGFAFGERVTVDGQGRQSHDFNLGDRGRVSFASSQRRHDRWKARREEWSGYADAEHSFRHQGSADINLYKLFLEQAHALLRTDAAGRPSPRLGLIVPSGLYSDFGTGELRRLFLDRCRWEWLFGFENREKIFDIDSRFKFNPIVIAKGGQTTSIRTAFMRRGLADWERGEQFATLYSRGQVLQFSPNTRAILEIPSVRDIEIMTKFHENGVLFSGSNQNNLSLRYSRELHMGDDAARFKNADSLLTSGGWVVPGVWESSDGERWLPLIEGRMVEPHHPFAKEWRAGRGRAAIWENTGLGASSFLPQYFVSQNMVRLSKKIRCGYKLGVMNITSATNERTAKVAFLPPFPCGDTVYTLQRDGRTDLVELFALAAVLNSFAADYQLRFRLNGLHLSEFVIGDIFLPRVVADSVTRHIAGWVAALNLHVDVFAPARLSLWKALELAETVPFTFAATMHERLRLNCLLDALVAQLFDLNQHELQWILRDCDFPASVIKNVAFSGTLNPKGFWRVDKDRHPEHRHTILSLIAFHDLQATIAECGGDVERGIEAFCRQNDGEGWMLPETLRLADYGLGQDARAREHQPVREYFGPRFYDWQLAQTPDESWRECHLHARNLLGPEGYQALLDELAGQPADRQPGTAAARPAGGEKPKKTSRQGKLFETEDLPLFDR